MSVKKIWKISCLELQMIRWLLWCSGSWTEVSTASQVSVGDIVSKAKGAAKKPAIVEMRKIPLSESDNMGVVRGRWEKSSQWEDKGVLRWEKLDEKKSIKEKMRGRPDEKEWDKMRSMVNTTEQSLLLVCNVYLFMYSSFLCFVLIVLANLISWRLWWW